MSNKNKNQITKPLSPTRQSAAKTLYRALQILKEASSGLPGREVINRIRTTTEFSDWERQIYEKTGNVRWESFLHFYTIDAEKAGFMRKSKGTWYLTDEGEKALEYGEVELLQRASQSYKEWVLKNKKTLPDVEEISLDNNSKETSEIVTNNSNIQKVNLDLLEEEAIAGIIDYIKRKTAYEFQDLVAALLRAMGYYTPFVSPKGKDGGLDIIAYNDPLGASTPRLKVQVKHRPESAVPVDDIRSLTGLLNKDGDIGLFVTSGTFTSESVRCARESHRHIKLLDISNFIDFWQQFYNKLSDEDKNLLPLHSIYFLGSND